MKDLIKADLSPVDLDIDIGSASAWPTIIKIANAMLEEGDPIDDTIGVEELKGILEEVGSFFR